MAVQLADVEIAVILMLGIALTGLVIAILRVNKTKKELESSERLRSELAQGEKRMLDFLHHLGLSIDNENTPRKLHRVIVEGVMKVTKSKGAALYLTDKAENILRPAYLTTDCAQLIPDPPAETAEQRAQLIKHAPTNRHEGVLGQSLHTNTPFLVDSLRAHPAFSDELVPYSADGAAMIAPLIHAGKQIGVLAVTKDSVKEAYTIDDLFTFTSVAEQSAFALGNFDAHHQAAEKKRMESEIQTAQEVQRVLIPQVAPIISGFQIYGYNVPAKMISGDYYDYTRISDNQTGVIIADVSGKGIPAGIIMATFRSSLKAIAEGASSPAESLSKLNKLIYPDIREDMFISAVYTSLNSENGTVTIARAGHNPPYYYQAAGDKLERIKPPGLAVGIDTGDVFSRILENYEISMQTGDLLILYTDGIIEAPNAAGEEFSSKRLEKCITAYKHLPPDQFADSILKEVKHYTGDSAQSDDITLVIIKKVEP